MWEIWVEYHDGTVECVDEAESTKEAEQMIAGYRVAFGPHNVKRVWKQKP